MGSSDEERAARLKKLERDYLERYEARQEPDFGARKRRLEQANRDRHQQKLNRKAG